jgi:hypothetical protein
VSDLTAAIAADAGYGEAYRERARAWRKLGDEARAKADDAKAAALGSGA